MSARGFFQSRAPNSVQRPNGPVSIKWRDSDLRRNFTVFRRYLSWYRARASCHAAVGSRCSLLQKNKKKNWILCPLTYCEPWHEDLYVFNIILWDLEARRTINRSYTYERRIIITVPPRHTPPPNFPQAGHRGNYRITGRRYGRDANQ